MEVVQVVLLFGSNTWILTPCLKKHLKGYHHRLAQRMTGIGTKRQWDGTWVYPPIMVALSMVVLEEIGVYIACLQNTVKHYIVDYPIMYLCLTAERKPGMCLSRKWWEKPALDIVGIRVGQVAA